MKKRYDFSHARRGYAASVVAQIALRLPPELLKRADQLALIRCVSRAAVLRAAIMRGLDELEREYPA